MRLQEFRVEVRVEGLVKVCSQLPCPGCAGFTYAHFPSPEPGLGLLGFRVFGF